MKKRYFFFPFLSYYFDRAFPHLNASEKESNTPELKHRAETNGCFLNGHSLRKVGNNKIKTTALNLAFTLLLSLFAITGWSQIIVDEDLGTGSLPSGWTQRDVTFTTAAGGYANFTSESSILTTSTFDASAYSSVDVSFDVAKFGTGGNGPITVEYSLDGGSTWSTQGNSTTPTSSTYQSDTISIPTSSAAMQVKLTRADSPSEKRLRDWKIEGLNSGGDGSSDCLNESFSNVGTYGGYQTEAWTGDDGGTWTATDARTDQTINDKAITVRDGTLTSPSISGGIGSLTVSTQRKFSGDSGNLDVTVNGSSVGSVPYDASVQTTTINNINIDGNVQVVIDATNSSSDRVAIDDLSWTCYAPTCAVPSQIVFDTPPSSITQSSTFSLQLQLLCPDNSLSNCDEGTVTLSSTACGLSGTLTASVSNGVAVFNDLIVSRSPQDNITFTAEYTGGCGNFTETSAPINVLEPIAGGVLASQNYEVPSTWDNEEPTIGNDGVFSTSNFAGYGASNGLAYYGESCFSSGVQQSVSSVTFSHSGIEPNVGVTFNFKVRISDTSLPEATTTCTNGGGIDSGEYIELETSVDGGAFTRTFIIEGWNDAYFPFNDNLINLNFNQDEVYELELIDYDIDDLAPSNFRVSIPDYADEVSFRFTMSSNRNNEVYVLDDLTLEAEDGETPSPVLTANVGDDFTGCNGGPNELSALVDDAQGALTYSWSPSGQISGSPTSQSVEAVNTNTQTFTVTATDEDGCAATDQVTVNIPSGPAGTWTNASGSDSWFDCRNWADGKVPDENTNVTVPTATSDPQIDDDAQNAFCEDLNLGNGRSIMLDGDPGLSLEVHGNISGSGSIQALIGHLIFGGSLPQTIAPDVDITTWGLTIDKPENHLESQTDINVNCEAYPSYCDGALFQNGVLKLSEGKKLIVGNGTAISEGSETSFVDGIIRKQGYEMDDEVIFPTGVLDLGGLGSADDQLYFQPASLTSPTVSASVFEVQYFQENYNEILGEPFNPPVVGLSKVSTCNYWTIDRVSGSDDMRVGLSWNEDYCFDVVDPSALTVARFNDIANEWEDAPFTPGVTQTNSGGPDFQTGWVRTDQVVENFSPFAIGAIGSELNVLPIELLWFDAERLNPTVVKTNWATAAEINNDFFTVERSTDGIHFDEIGEVPGAGNSNSEINYRFDDDGASPATTYYRLKQTDFDGTFTYSNVVAVGGTKDRGQLEITRVYNSESGLEVWHTRSQTPLIAEVFDLTGKRLLVKQVDGSSNRFVLHPQIARGIYFVRLSAEGEFDTAKFFY